MSSSLGISFCRAIVVSLALVACQAPPPSVTDMPGFSYIHSKRRTEADVARASEAFYAREKHGQDVVFRTTESERAGYYFYFKLDFDPPPQSRLVLEVTRTENVAPERYDFSLSLKPKFPWGEYVVGLTGKEAGGPKWIPVAWCLTIVDAQGKILASQHSFLWGTPMELEAN